MVNSEKPLGTPDAPIANGAPSEVQRATSDTTIAPANPAGALAKVLNPTDLAAPPVLPPPALAAAPVGGSGGSPGPPAPATTKIDLFLQQVVHGKKTDAQEQAFRLVYERAEAAEQRMVVLDESLKNAQLEAHGHELKETQLREKLRGYRKVSYTVEVMAAFSALLIGIGGAFVGSHPIVAVPVLVIGIGILLAALKIKHAGVVKDMSGEEN
jgi:hypothetical protein